MTVSTERKGTLSDLEYERMFEAEDRYFWFVAKHRLIAEILERELAGIESPRVLDAGCGAGGLLAGLPERYRIAGLDASAGALEYCRRRGLDNLSEGTVEYMPFDDSSFDAVVASDLIEHVDDDLGAASKILRVLDDGGVAVVTVPAHPFLFGPHDIILGHRRRYARSHLGRLLTTAGFSRIEIRSFMNITSPIMVASRLAGKLIHRRSSAEAVNYRIPDFLNRLLIAALDAERHAFMRGVDPGAGSTLVAVARK